MIVPNELPKSLPQLITAIGGLGTAAFGLVDATKALWFGGVNRIGFNRIKTQVEALTPGTAANALSQSRVIDTLRANWYNGTALTAQKSIAKTLIKVGLSPANAPALAAATGVDPAVLGSIAAKIISGISLVPAESDVNGRFDFVITALLDEVYQDADQAYTNGTRLWAGFFAMLLALTAGWCLKGGLLPAYFGSSDFWLAFLVGILAVPLAPIAKNLSSALVAAVNTLQTIKK